MKGIMMNPEQEECVIYARFSPRPDAETCESIATQVVACREHAAKHGWGIVGQYEDKNISGADPDRPGLWDAIVSVPKGGILLAYRLNRIARDVHLFETVRRRIVYKHGGRIETVMENMRGQTPEEKFQMHILVAMAEYERACTSRHVAAALKRLRNDNRRYSRHPEYGTRLDPNNPRRTIPHEREQANIQTIIGLRRRGLPFNQIGLEMDRLGVPTRTGKAWHRNQIQRILKRLDLE